jgi:hypothetical protein
MSNVWLLPPDTDTAPDAAPDDHLVRLSGEDAEIARVSASGPEWLGSVPASALGALPSAGGGPARIEDQQVLIAVQGAASALNEQGG